MTNLLFEDEDFIHEDICRELKISNTLNTSNLEEIKKCIKKDEIITDACDDDNVDSDSEDYIRVLTKKSESEKYMQEMIEYGDLDKVKELYEFCKLHDKKFKLSNLEFRKLYNNKHTKVLKWIYEEKHAFKSKIFTQNRGILHCACIAGSLDVVKYVMDILEKKKIIKEKYDNPINILSYDNETIEAILLSYSFKAFYNDNFDVGLWFYNYLKSKNIINKYIFEIEYILFDTKKTFYHWLFFSSYKSIEFLTKQMKECLPEEEFQKIVFKKFEQLCDYTKKNFDPHRRDAIFSDFEMAKKFEKNIEKYFDLFLNNIKNKEEAIKVLNEISYARGKGTKYLFIILDIAEKHNINIEWDELHINEIYINEMHHGMEIWSLFTAKRITENNLVTIMINYIDDVIGDNEHIHRSCAFIEHYNCNYFDSENISRFFKGIFKLLCTNTEFKKKLAERLHEKKYSVINLLIFFAKYCVMYDQADVIYVYNILNEIFKFNIFDNPVEYIENIDLYAKENSLDYELVDRFIIFYRHLCVITNQMKNMFVYKEEKHKNIYYMYFVNTKYNSLLPEIKCLENDNYNLPNFNYELPYLDGDEIKYFSICKHTNIFNL